MTFISSTISRREAANGMVPPAVRHVFDTSPPGAPVPPILPPNDGFLFLDREKFHESFAGDLTAQDAAFLADSQVPWATDALGGTVSQPAWRTKPSWYLLTTEDRMIPPPVQRAMPERADSTIVEVAAIERIETTPKKSPITSSAIPSSRSRTSSSSRAAPPRAGRRAPLKTAEPPPLP